jgi:predicted small lipoprotein YifL
MTLSVEKAQRLLKLSVFSSILLLAACGQKGPLYLESAEEVKTSKPVDDAKPANPEQ